MNIIPWQLLQWSNTNLYQGSWQLLTPSGTEQKCRRLVSQSPGQTKGKNSATAVAAAACPYPASISMTVKQNQSPARPGNTAGTWRTGLKHIMLKPSRATPWRPWRCLPSGPWRPPSFKSGQTCTPWRWHSVSLRRSPHNWNAGTRGRSRKLRRWQNRKLYRTEPVYWRGSTCWRRSYRSFALTLIQTLDTYGSNSRYLDST